MSSSAAAADSARRRCAAAAARVTRCCCGCRGPAATDEVPRDSRAEALVTAARDGDARSLARLVSLVENGSPELRPVMRAVAPHAGNARVVGLTGSPGVGKSTVTAALVRAYRALDLRVGVIVVEPTWPLAGGALVGARVRMTDQEIGRGDIVRSYGMRG